jgi:hypothetical protein
MGYWLLIDVVIADRFWIARGPQTSRIFRNRPVFRKSVPENAKFVLFKRTPRFFKKIIFESRKRPGFLPKPSASSRSWFVKLSNKKWSLRNKVLVLELTDWTIQNALFFLVLDLTDRTSRNECFVFFLLGFWCLT